MMRILLTSMILVCAAGCESRAASSDAASALPTRLILPTAQIAAQTLAPPAFAPPTERPLRAIDGARPTQPPVIATFTPISVASGVSPTPAVDAPAFALTPIASQTALSGGGDLARPGGPAPFLPEAFTFGRSAGGRDLLARRFGDGPALLLLVGGVHGGWETNTTELMRLLIAHFEANPGDVLPGMRVVIVPALNPDGAALGRVLEGRFNGNGVDLNRNWGCGWQAEAVFQNRAVNAGSGPMSEPETLALAGLINDARPGAVLLYHSAAGGVFAGGCDAAFAEVGEALSDSMAAVMGEATGYSYGVDFSAYPVTGTAPAWIASLGIASADVELETWQEPEFERNLRGVLAVQCWLLGASAVGLPACL